MAKNDLQNRNAPIDLSPDDFRQLGHDLIDQIADYLASIPERPVAPGKVLSEIQAILGADKPLPETGTAPAAALNEATELLFNNSSHCGHPRFLGYVIGSPAPLGMLGDLLAAAINPNTGGWSIAPMATEIETQTVRWIASLIGYPEGCGGLLVSGGAMANYVGFLAGRRAKATWNIRTEGMNSAGSRAMRVYASAETHTWIQKAADLFGLGTDSIRWVETDDQFRMDTGKLVEQIEADKASGDLPVMVVGTAGSVSTGAVDPLPEIAEICKTYDLWFHIDGAYGAFAAAIPDAGADILGVRLADSVALDPHKWMYQPLEAGCVLVRDAQALLDAFSYRPPYYTIEPTEGLYYYEYGMQNSRGFRALKVWLSMRQVGREGYQQMIVDDVRLATEFYQIADAHPELQAFTHSLSITTYRYVPADLEVGEAAVEDYLNALNTELMSRIDASGEAFITSAMLKGTYVLRLCIVNFRTSLKDMEALAEITARIGKTVDAELRGKLLA